MWTYQMRRMLFMCCLVLGTGSLKSAGVKLPRSVPYLKPVFSPRSTTTKFAFVHVIDDLKKEAKQRHLDEPEAYWLASSGVADMGMCVLAAQITNLRLHNASGDHVIITRHVDVQDPRVMTFLDALDAFVFKSTVQQFYTHGNVRISKNVSELVWGIMSQTILKVGVFGLVHYEKLLFLDLDVFAFERCHSIRSQAMQSRWLYQVEATHHLSRA